MEVYEPPSSECIGPPTAIQRLGELLMVNGILSERLLPESLHEVYGVLSNPTLSRAEAKASLSTPETNDILIWEMAIIRRVHRALHLDLPLMELFRHLEEAQVKRPSPKDMQPEAIDLQPTVPVPPEELQEQSSPSTEDVGVGAQLKALLHKKHPQATTAFIERFSERWDVAPTTLTSFFSGSRHFHSITTLMMLMAELEVSPDRAATLMLAFSQEKARKMGANIPTSISEAHLVRYKALLGAE